MKKQPVRVVLALLVLAFAVWAGIRMLRSEPVPVRVVRVDRGVVESSVANSKAGTVQARRRASLAPRTGGSVRVIGKREGAHVEEGDIILSLDDATERADLILAERSLDVADASLKRSCLAAQRARQQLDRQLELGKLKIVSVDVVEEAQSAHDLAVAGCAVGEADVARARAAVDVARSSLEKTILRAPFPGVVAELKVEAGEWITPAPPMIQMPTLVDLIDTSSLYVSAPMDEVDSGLIQAGQRAKITLDPFPGRTLGGRVTRVAPYVLDVESQNRTVEVEVELEDAGFASKLLPGTSADVEVVLEVRQGVLRVPTAALIEGGRVLVLEGGLLVERRIVAGVRNWELTEVSSGLEEGDRVVVSLDRAEVRAGAAAVEEAQGLRP